jgi:hypothetical protein
MKDDPIVSEVRRIRAALWQESGCDLSRLAELARQEAARIPNLGPLIENAEELRRHAEQQEIHSPALREQSPPYGHDAGGKS